MFSEEGKKSCLQHAVKLLDFPLLFISEEMHVIWVPAVILKTYEGESVLETKFPHNPQWEKSV